MQLMLMCLVNMFPGHSARIRGTSALKGSHTDIQQSTKSTTYGECLAQIENEACIRRGWAHLKIGTGCGGLGLKVLRPEGSEKSKEALESNLP